MVAVLTYRRPAELGALLPELVRQAAAVTGPCRVLVVDNDPAQGAAQVVDRCPDPRVQYVAEPRPGIAAARNRALQAAQGADLLVFIDDDEQPVPSWLQALLDVHAGTGAAGVVGPVVSRFAGQPEPWIVAGQFFRRRRLPTGTDVDVAATNNLLLDLAQVRALGLRFDERFGLSGGSDTLFTRQLVRRGGRLVWCDEALVVDRVPLSRLTRRWVLQRALRSGNSRSRTSVELAHSAAGRLRARCAGTLHGGVRVAAGGTRAVAGVLLRRQAWQALGFRTLARGLGMVGGAWGWTWSEYRRPVAAGVQPAAVAPPGPVPGEVRLGVVVVNFASAHLLDRHLAGLDLPAVPATVVVVDNFSSLDQRRRLLDLAGRYGWECVLLDRNTGFGSAVNRGVQRARELGCAVYLLLNPDAEVASDVLRELLRTSIEQPLALVTPRVVRPDGSTWFDGGQLDLRTGRTRTARRDLGPSARPWLTAACLVVHEQMWERLAGIDERYFLYWEDVDLSHRCLQQGGSLLVRHDLEAVHSVGGTQRRTGKSSRYAYYNCRNRLLFAAAHLPPAAVLRWLRLAPGYAVSVVLRGGRRQLLRSPAPVAAAVAGTVSGALRATPKALRRHRAATGAGVRGPR